MWTGYLTVGFCLRMVLVTMSEQAVENLPRTYLVLWFLVGPRYAQLEISAGSSLLLGLSMESSD